MALTKCNDCGHQISESAAACPNCGALRPGPLLFITKLFRFILRFIRFIAILFIFIIIMLFLL